MLEAGACNLELYPDMGGNEEQRGLELPRPSAEKQRSTSQLIKLNSPKELLDRFVAVNGNTGRVHTPQEKTAQHYTHLIQTTDPDRCSLSTAITHGVDTSRSFSTWPCRATPRIPPHESRPFPWRCQVLSLSRSPPRHTSPRAARSRNLCFFRYIPDPGSRSTKPPKETQEKLQGRIPARTTEAYLSAAPEARRGFPVL